MIVRAIKDITTTASPVTYRLTLEVNVWDLQDENKLAFGPQLEELVLSAIGGLDNYYNKRQTEPELPPTLVDTVTDLVQKPKYRLTNDGPVPIQ